MIGTKRFLRAVKEWSSKSEFVLLLILTIMVLIFLFNPTGRVVFNYITYVLLIVSLVCLALTFLIELEHFYKHYKKIVAKEIAKENRGKDIYFYLDFQALKYCSKYFYASYVADTKPVYPHFIEFYLRDKKYKNIYFATSTEYVDAISYITEKGDLNNSFPGYAEYIRANFKILDSIAGAEKDIEKIISGKDIVRVDAAYNVKLNYKEFDELVLVVIGSNKLLDTAEQLGIKNVLEVTDNSCIIREIDD